MLPADFEGSGKPGIVFINASSGPGYLAGNGDGTFQPEADLHSGILLTHIKIGDLNGTGTHDLVATFGQADVLSSTGGILAIANTPVKSLTTVNGASFAAGQPVAPNSIASAFGSGLIGNGGTSVVVSDATGTQTQATVFGATASQVNFLVPGSAAAGTGTVVITPAGGSASRGPLTIAPVAPGLFTADGMLANGFVVTADAQGNQSAPAYTVQADPAHPGQFLPAPVPLSSVATAVLELFGTGIRGASADLVNVSMSFAGGGITIKPAYAGAQPQFAGEDQVNLVLPPALKGAGDVAITITASGQSSNAVHIYVQ
jgi:uncharacterized protein (TIGR03437 family)